MSLASFIRRVRKRIDRIRLTPIRVYCIHEVSESYNPATTWESDWVQIDDFKAKIERLREGNEFISLPEAYGHIAHDIIRRKRYCVLTCDDGASSIKGILPWLAERGISITLFVNPAILEGKEKREKPMEMLSVSELHTLYNDYSPVITVGNHGYSHLDSGMISLKEFEDNVERSEEFLSREFPDRIPFFAYPLNGHNGQTDMYLRSKGIIPVYCDGNSNYGDSGIVHRELL